AANPTALLRTGAVIIANQAFVLSQMGAPCLFELFPSSRLHGPRNETGLVTVITIPGCDWTVHNSNDWVTISSRADGTGQGFFLYTVASNATPVARVGFLELPGQSFAITNLGNVALSCPLDKIVECASQWSFDEPAVATGCPDTNVLLRIVSTLTNLSICGHTFTATRTWEALDGCSNRVRCSQKVTVADTLPPLLTCAGVKGVVCGAGWSFDEPVAFDLADGANVNITILSTITNGNCGQTFAATRAWMATDQCGNASTCSQTVTNVQIVISGMIAYPASSLSNRPLASAWVNLSGDATQRIQTASDGSYRFTVNAGGSFSVTPELPDSDPGAHGVSTVDLSLIRRHILN